jgi:hypothetical protein
MLRMRKKIGFRAGFRFGFENSGCGMSGMAPYTTKKFILPFRISGMAKGIS